MMTAVIPADNVAGVELFERIMVAVRRAEELGLSVSALSQKIGSKDKIRAWIVRAGQGLAIYVRPLPPDLGSSEGLLLASGLHVRHDPDPAVVARRAYVLLACHLLRRTQPTERDVWTLAARLAPEKERGNSLVLRRMRQK